MIWMALSVKMLSKAWRCASAFRPLLAYCNPFWNLSLAFPTEAEAEQAFAALSQGGQVRMPMTQTFWSPRFGMVTDQFGLGWMVTVAR